MSEFYRSGGSGNISEDDNEDNLPYPQALPRADFLSPNFDAPTYLATLSDRHQTLEDLQSDLRERSQFLSKELLDLVNANYEQFLSLGSDLKGGEERLEDVRVGLLGFNRSVTDIRQMIGARKDEVQGLLGEKIGVSRQITVGRKLLEFDARLEELEDSLMIACSGDPVNQATDDFWDYGEDDRDTDDELSAVGNYIGKLHRLAQNFRSIGRLMESIGTRHLFIIAQQSRVRHVKNTILLDLSTALRQAQFTNKGKARLIRILSIYRDLGAADEAVRILKDTKSE